MNNHLSCSVCFQCNLFLQICTIIIKVAIRCHNGIRASQSNRFFLYRAASGVFLGFFLSAKTSCHLVHRFGTWWSTETSAALEGEAEMLQRCSQMRDCSTPPAPASRPEPDKVPKSSMKQLPAQPMCFSHYVV